MRRPQAARDTPRHSPPIAPRRHRGIADNPSSLPISTGRSARSPSCLTAMDEVISQLGINARKQLRAGKFDVQSGPFEGEPDAALLTAVLALARASSSCEPVQAAIGNHAQIAVSDLVVSEAHQRLTPALAACPNRDCMVGFQAAIESIDQQEPGYHCECRNIDNLRGPNRPDRRSGRHDPPLLLPVCQQVRPVLADRIRRPRSHVVAERAPTNLGNNRFQLVVQAWIFHARGRRPQVVLTLARPRIGLRSAPRTPIASRPKIRSRNRITRRELTSGTRIRR